MNKLSIKQLLIVFVALTIVVLNSLGSNSKASASKKFHNDLIDQKISIQVNNKTLDLEYADTPSKRQLGLMFRKSLCDECGMLFKFDFERIGSIWMKNTYIPLDLAYVDKKGEIIDIFQLQPHDLTPIESSKKVLYAIEMNKGWFAKNDIREGDFINNLP